MGCSSLTIKCIKSKYVWAFILTMIAFVLFCFLFEHMSQQNEETNDDYNFYVSNSTMFDFSYNTTTTTLSYNFILLIIVANNHVSLDYVNATASYLNLRFASKPEETLIQGFTGLRMHFNGENVVAFTEDQLSMLDKNHTAGLYNVTVRIWPSKLIGKKDRTCEECCSM